MLMKIYLINNSSRIISSFGKVSPCTSGWISSVFLVSRKYVNLPNAEVTDFSCLQLVTPKSQPQHLPFWAQVHRNTGDKICNLCKLKVMLWFETPKSDVLWTPWAHFALWMSLELSQMSLLSSSHKLLPSVAHLGLGFCVLVGTPVASYPKVIFQPPRIT